MAVIEEITPVTETLDEIEGKDENEETSASDTGAAAPDGDAPKDGDKDTTEDATVVTIGDEVAKPEVHDNETIRQMRQRIRELEKNNKELQRTPQTQALGKKPTLADFEYDEDKYAPALADYLRREASVNDEQARIEREAQAQQAAFQSRLHSYGAEKTALKIPHFDDAEAAVQEALDDKQQACIIKYAKNPALVVAALGANPGKLKEFAGKKDLGEFVYALADVEKMLKVTKRPQIPEPEKRMQGETTATGAAEGTLDRLRAEAEKTGDVSKVLAYKRKQQRAA